MLNIRLIPLKQTVRLDELGEAGDGAPKLIIADAYVAGAEDWQPQRWGWATERDGRSVLNVDHHAPTASMRRAVSSGNLALEYVAEQGPLRSDQGRVLINHCDCDSVVSSAILAGIVPADPRFGRAVLAADHTGHADEIADALQPLESLRDLELSLATLRQLLDGEPLSEPARGLMEARLRERAAWGEAIQRADAVRWVDRVAVVVRPDRVPTELLVSLVPEAVAIMTAKPAGDGKWVAKLRLGLAAPNGMSLLDLGIQTFDPAFGGRWNAGSNNRGGGAPIDPETYAANLAAAIRRRSTTQ
ncbi:MAG: hypothetical protein EA381_20400 [Planctomycetaceae bacterium]|nr:MAG: hypothetical protein EA381_20400 [Planctomycetaceae bacterium]